MPASIENILLTNGPMLTIDLKVKLLEAGLTDAAARKRISRVRGSVKKLFEINFYKKSKFIYHEKHFGTVEYWDTLFVAINKYCPAHTSAISALRARGGIFPYQYFFGACGSPVFQKKHIPAEKIINDLVSIKVFDIEEIIGLGRCIRFHEKTKKYVISTNDMRARLKTENMLLLTIQDWVKKLGYASYDKVEIRKENVTLPKVGNFNWDLAGPSYHCYIRQAKPDRGIKPGFFVCDVVYAENISVEAMTSFVRKYEMTTVLKKIAPLIPFFIADSFSEDAYKKARSIGVIATTPDILFGKEVSKGLQMLLETFMQLGEIAKSRPEIIDELFNKLSHIEGAAINLRGDLFEILVGHCIHKKIGGSIEIGQIAKSSDIGGTIEKAEMDVCLTKGNEKVIVYECKGYQPTKKVKVDEIENWVSKKIPIMYRSLKSNRYREQCKYEFEFWTCGTFTNDAEEYLKNKSKRTHKYKINWKNGSQVRDFIKSLNNKSLLDTFDEHFYHHPINRVERKNRG